jgi:hypothetical protein
MNAQHKKIPESLPLDPLKIMKKRIIMRKKITNNSRKSIYLDFGY